MAQPHDRPTAAELVAAVREFLERDVLAAAEGRVRFHTRVAINVLGMVERELALGPAQAAAHAERLARLGFGGGGDGEDDGGGDGEAALAAAIRAGELDDRAAELRAALIESVRDKLLVANPAYLE